jgi:hypothetical protein
MDTEKLKIVTNFIIEVLKILLAPMAVALLVGALVWSGKMELGFVKEFTRTITDALKGLR